MCSDCLWYFPFFWRSSPILGMKATFIAASDLYPRVNNPLIYLENDTIFWYCGNTGIWYDNQSLLLTLFLILHVGKSLLFLLHLTT